MSIVVCFVGRKIALLYDFDTCNAFIGRDLDMADVSVGGIELGRSDGDCIYGEILFLENRKVLYSRKEAMNAADRISRAALFGREGSNERVINSRSGAPEPERRRDEIVDLAKLVFGSRGRTKWQTNSGQSGVLRLYPSNGAIHALRPKIVCADMSIEYFPYSELTTFQPMRSECGGIYVEIILELDRILEKYRDVGALVAVYVELGHMIAVFSRYGRFKISRVSLMSPLCSDLTNTLSIARVYYES